MRPKPPALSAVMEEAGAMSCLNEFLAAPSFVIALDQFPEPDRWGDQATQDVQQCAPYLTNCCGRK